MARKRQSVSDAGGLALTGTARVDADPGALARRLKAGDVAILDIQDLDRRTAQILLDRRPAAVVNARASISGRYPSGGPQILLDAGVLLLDSCGSAVLGVRDGEKIRLEGEAIYRGEERLATGTVQTPELVSVATANAVDGMGVQLATFTANAMDYVAHDAPLLLDGTGLPYTHVELEDRHVLVVGAAPGAMEELGRIRAYLTERRPVIIAVADVADEVKKNVYAPEIVIGSIEATADDTLTAAREVILHDPTGADPGLARAEALGLTYREADATVGSADIGILMAHAASARLIVTAGMESNLAEFLERGHHASASTFLARLAAGGTLVNAASLPHIHKQRYSAWVLIALMGSAVIMLANALAITPGGAAWLRSVVPWLGLVWGGQ